MYKRQALGPTRACIRRVDLDEMDVDRRGVGACLQLVLQPVSYTHLRAHETVLDLVCRLLLVKKKHTIDIAIDRLI